MVANLSKSVTTILRFSKTTTPTTPTTPPSKSEEALKFESAIARGSWSNVFRSFGPQIVNNRGQMLDGVNIDMFDATGMTALHAAAYVGNEQLVPFGAVFG